MNQIGMNKIGTIYSKYWQSHIFVPKKKAENNIHHTNIKQFHVGCLIMLLKSLCWKRKEKERIYSSHIQPHVINMESIYQKIFLVKKKQLLLSMDKSIYLFYYYYFIHPSPWSWRHGWCSDISTCWHLCAVFFLGKCTSICE